MILAGTECDTGGKIGGGTGLGAEIRPTILILIMFCMSLIGSNMMMVGLCPISNAGFNMILKMGTKMATNEGMHMTTTVVMNKTTNVGI